jgi:hypothetical protein
MEQRKKLRELYQIEKEKFLENPNFRGQLISTNTKKNFSGDEKEEKDIQMKEKLEQKSINENSVSYFTLQFNLAKKFDILIIIIGIISSLGLAISMPLFSILFGGTLNDLGDQNSLDRIKSLCLQFFLVGLGMFGAGALMICCWSYSGRMITNYIKKKYFYTIMLQEQGWFDTQEVYEFSTRVQSQTKIIGNGVLKNKIKLIDKFFYNNNL